MSSREFKDSTSDKWFLKVARYSGTCVKCGEPVAEGDEVYMRPVVQEDGRKVWEVSHSRHGEPS